MSEDGTLVKAEKKQSVRYLNHAVLKKMSISEDYHMETEEKEIDSLRSILNVCVPLGKALYVPLKTSFQEYNNKILFSPMFLDPEFSKNFVFHFVLKPGKEKSKKGRELF